MTIKENFEEFHNAASQSITLFFRLLLTILYTCFYRSASFVDMLREMTYTTVEEVYTSRGIDIEIQMNELKHDVLISEIPYAVIDESLTVGYGYTGVDEFKYYENLAMKGV